MVKKTPKDVMNVLTEAPLVPKWDKECVGSYEIERFSENFSFVYLGFKGTMLGGAQTDFVLAQVVRELSDGTICIINRSLPNGEDLVPEKKGFVRCRMETGGWMLEKIKDDPPETRITSIQEVDYENKANKRTLDAAKARMVSIVALRDFLAQYKKSVDNRRSLVL